MKPSQKVKFRSVSVRLREDEYLAFTLLCASRKTTRYAEIQRFVRTELLRAIGSTLPFESE